MESFLYCVLGLFILQTATPTVLADGSSRAERDIGSTSSFANNNKQYSGYSSLYPNNQFGSYQASSSLGKIASPSVGVAPVAPLKSSSSVAAAPYYGNSQYAYQPYSAYSAYNSYNAYPYSSYPYNYPSSSYYNSGYYNNNYYPYNSQYSNAAAATAYNNRYPYSSPYYYGNNYNNGQYYNNYNYDQYYRSGFGPAAAPAAAAAAYSAFPYSASPYYSSVAAYPTAPSVAESSEKKE